MATKLLRRRVLLLIALSLLAAPFMAPAAQAADVTVFAAASLKNALDDAAKLYQTQDRRQGQHQLCRVLGAGQADRGRRAGRHLLLGRSRLDGLSAKKKLIDDASRHTLLGNTLVLVAPEDSTVRCRS